MSRILQRCVFRGCDCEGNVEAEIELSPFPKVVTDRMGSYLEIIDCHDKFTVNVCSMHSNWVRHNLVYPATFFVNKDTWENFDVSEYGKRIISDLDILDLK